MGEAMRILGDPAEKSRYDATLVMNATANDIGAAARAMSAAATAARAEAARMAQMARDAAARADTSSYAARLAEVVQELNHAKVNELRIACKRADPMRAPCSIQIPSLPHA